jgi:hypothetical protein
MAKKDSLARSLDGGGKQHPAGYKCNGPYTKKATYICKKKQKKSKTTRKVLKPKSKKVAKPKKVSKPKKLTKAKKLASLEKHVFTEEEKEDIGNSLRKMVWEKKGNQVPEFEAA